MGSDQVLHETAETTQRHNKVARPQVASGVSSTWALSNDGRRRISQTHAEKCGFQDQTDAP
jgi:hypothetical protein